MKSYVRHSNNPRTAYQAELERALREGFAAGMAHALFCLHLSKGFGGKRLKDVAETADDLAGGKKGRCTDIKAEVDLLKNKYGVDVWEIKPKFKVKQETTAQRSERMKNNDKHKSGK